MSITSVEMVTAQNDLNGLAPKLLPKLDGTTSWGQRIRIRLTEQRPATARPMAADRRGASGAAARLARAGPVCDDHMHTDERRKPSRHGGLRHASRSGGTGSLFL